MLINITASSGREVKKGAIIEPRKLVLNFLEPIPLSIFSVNSHDETTKPMNDEMNIKYWFNSNQT